MLQEGEMEACLTVGMGAMVLEKENSLVVFNLGDCVHAPISDMGAFTFIVGSVVYVNKYFFVIRSVVGGFTVSYNWTETLHNPVAFRKVSVCEAFSLVADRLCNRELLL